MSCCCLEDDFSRNIVNLNLTIPFKKIHCDIGATLNEMHIIITADINKSL